MSQRLLNPSHGIKPLDFGGDGITGSIDLNGHLIALNTYHALYGYSTLTVAAPFSDALRYRPSAVRAYRASLVNMTGFGPICTRYTIHRDSYLLEDAIPHIQFDLGEGRRAECTIFATQGGAFQRWTFKDVPMPIVWRGTLSLQRSAYTQLTEGGPLPNIPVVGDVILQDGILSIENPYLKQTVAIIGLWDINEKWEAHYEANIDLVFHTNSEHVELVFAFGDTPTEARQRVQQLAQLDWQTLCNEQRQLWQNRWQNVPDNLLVRRGLAYGLMLSVPVGETICLLTDHMLLPLSWNRDAYYIARAFLQWNTPESVDIVRKHLLWMFEVAERVDGWWGRAYLANGRIKDRGFQLDQQIFPLLELAEYVLSTADLSTLERLKPHVHTILDQLNNMPTNNLGLYPTSETPADDPIALPYHLSSHILIWHTLRKLDKVLPERRAELQEMTQRIRQSIDKNFVTQYEELQLYAYATDGHQHYHFYHDANDTPTVMAAEWALVDKLDPIWLNTMAFAFSERNKGGFYDKRLGSVHTPAPWPLGDIQALQIAKTLEDEKVAQEIEALLERVAQWDGALPEAYDSRTYYVISRHWFAWPNALLATLYLPPLEEKELEL
ncbi:MAG: hypothetical protein CUN55_10580 [Phototrophicales bacterium]|nr:MAG: hypothetical protein CUN55_10580 [Phototrophicales bacterium]